MEIGEWREVGSRGVPTGISEGLSLGNGVGFVELAASSAKQGERGGGEAGGLRRGISGGWGSFGQVGRRGGLQKASHLAVC